MSPKTKDVFIIHSKGDPVENALTERVLDTLLRLGISVYEYDDWTWSTRQPGKVRYHSSGTQLDPVRLAMGHPEPFKSQAWEEVVDRDVLEEMLAGSRAVLFIAPRSGTMSPGVREEYTTLPHDSDVMLATWGEQNDWLVEENRHTYLYRVLNGLNPDVEKAALDLVHLLWLHWTLDFLAHEGRDAGRDLLTILAQQDPAILRMVRFSGRTPESLRKRMNALGKLERSGEAAAIAALGHSLAADDARRVTACLWKQLSVRYVLDVPATKSVAELLRGAKHTFEWFCNAALDKNPELVDEWASGLRIGAAYAAGAWDKGEFAERLLGNALATPQVSAGLRSELLADRAAITSRRSPAQAQADIDEILTLDGARGASRLQAFYLRAKRAIRAKETEKAIADLSSALEVPEANPLLRALCHHDRATLRAGAGDHARAIEDLDAVLAIPELPPIVKGPALLDRGVIRGEVGDHEGEIADFTRVLELKGVPDEVRIKAHCYRGMSRKDRGDRLGAIEDFVVVRDDPQSPVEAVRSAKRYLGALGDPDE